MTTYALYRTIDYDNSIIARGLSAVDAMYFIVEQDPTRYFQLFADNNETFRRFEFALFREGEPGGEILLQATVPFTNDFEVDKSAALEVIALQFLRIAHKYWDGRCDTDEQVDEDLKYAVDRGDAGRMEREIAVKFVDALALDGYTLARDTGHRIKYAKVDADTGEEVANEDIVKGYKIDTDTYVEVSKDELENVALESTRIIEIDEFVDRGEIDPRYLIRPYYLRPDGKVGHDAFAVIRETIREMNKVAIGRVVLTNREHIIALEPMDKGLMGTLLRYPYEVRPAEEYFDEIQDVKVTKDMLDLARHIVNQKAGRFEPEKFEDQYETALVDLINQKRAGKPITPKERPSTGNVVDLMDALRKSVGGAAAESKAPKKSAKRPRKAAAGQREMLMPIAGKKPKEAAAKKSASKQQQKSA